MKLSRYFALLVVGGVLLGLAACSSPTTAGASGGGGSTTVSVTRVGTVPWVAVQDGSGAWQTLSGSSFVVSNSAGKYGVAWECTPTSGQPLVQITQETTADGTAVTTSCQTPGAVTTYNVSGTVSGIPTNGSAVVAVGSATTKATYAGFGQYSLSSVSGGVQTVLAYGLTSASAFTSMVRGNITITGNLTENINLGGTGSAPITTANVLKLAGVPSGETPALAVDLASAGAPAVTFAAATSTSLAYPLVPSALAATGDKYLLLGAAQASTSTTGTFQADIFVSQSPSNGATLQVPAALSSGAGVGVTGGSASASWGSVSFAGSGLTGYVAAVVPATPSSAEWSATVTGDWLGSSTTYDFPDFSATSGWNTNWNFPTGVGANATVLALHANVSLPELVAFSQGGNYSSLPNGTSLEVTDRGASGTY